MSKKYFGMVEYEHFEIALLEEGRDQDWNFGPCDTLAEMKERIRSFYEVNERHARRLKNNAKTFTEKYVIKDRDE